MVFCYNPSILIYVCISETTESHLYKEEKKPSFGIGKLGGQGGGLGGGHGGGGGQKNKRKQKKQQSLVQRIMPLMIIPFIISTALIPVMLFIIKILFVKAALVAKVAVVLGLISFLRRRTNKGGVYNHNAWKMR
ncbi:hypothetical protein HHI36_016582 [Cryptolaemus montrouzieri]|uniref:Uncharacterized protein n=1 Tax=Cryptolaemus montrouzieri TaxID=559131 RepID=A0ABD2NK38_9CUCU